MPRRARRQAQYAELRDRPAVTKDGERVNLFINAGLLVDLPHISETGAESREADGGVAFGARVIDEQARRSA